MRYIFKISIGPTCLIFIFSFFFLQFHPLGFNFGIFRSDWVVYICSLWRRSFSEITGHSDSATSFSKRIHTVTFFFHVRLVEMFTIYRLYFHFLLEIVFAICGTLRSMHLLFSSPDSGTLAHGIRFRRSHLFRSPQKKKKN